MGNFCIEEFLLQRQTELLGWVGVQEAPQNPGKKYSGGTALLTVGHRPQVSPKHRTKASGPYEPCWCACLSEHQRPAMSDMESISR